ncbi:MAG: uracil-DNA glycosylase family protein [Saprospiraceae bacterium]|nr:uracil-DNA glycosylase family protein [Saprospiraceae bacterium]
MALDLIQEAKNCTICAAHLPEGPRPVFTIHPDAKVVIIGQAPGRKVHVSGIPWDDASGKRLRQWLGVDEDTFYNPMHFAILPMGFCFPGTGKSGDLPPRPECAPKWHDAFMAMMPHKALTLLIGNYAQPYYLSDRMEKNMTETVRHWQKYLPEFLPLPHPSPRNIAWFKRNPWFETEILPFLKDQVRQVI